MRMVRFIKNTVFTFCLMMPLQTAVAQQPESATIIALMQPFRCNGLGNATDGDQVIFLENFVDGILPSTVYLTGTTWWIEAGQGGQLFDAAHTGNVVSMVDPQQRYMQKSGFPNGQGTTVFGLKKIAFMNFIPGGQSFKETKLDPPVRYSAGDAIIVSPECSGSPPPYKPFLYVEILAPTPGQDLANLPMPTTLMDTSISFGGNNQPPTTIRTVANPTPLAAPITKFRARMFLGRTGPFFTTIQHLSVCVQAAAGSSNCVAPPVELLVNGQHGYRISQAQHMWTDWTNFSAPAGATLLVTASMFDSNPANNNWTYRGTGAYGLWTATVDSWNSANMLGTVVYTPAGLAVIDGSQAQ